MCIRLYGVHTHNTDMEYGVGIPESRSYAIACARACEA